MKKKKKSKLEEYHTGKTTDLRNVIAEIQKVDQETSDLSAVVEEAQRIDRRRKADNSEYTFRLLFSSVMDKVFLFCLMIGFVVVSFYNFKGNIFGLSYGYWIRFLKEFLIVIIFLILSLLCNWLYKCIIKTMICVTNNSITREVYFPFWKIETSIPIQHITSVSSFSFFLIIRGVVINQYNRFPILFFTWNHQLLKSKLDKLLHNDSIDYNGAAHKTIFRRKYYPVLRWFFLISVMMIILLGIVRFFGYISNSERKISGTYIKGNQSIKLMDNGECLLRLLNITKLKKCKWQYNEKKHTIRINYEFSKKNYYGDLYESKDSITVGYKDDLLIYNGVEYKKK